VLEVYPCSRFFRARDFSVLEVFPCSRFFRARGFSVLKAFPCFSLICKANARV